MKGGWAESLAKGGDLAGGCFAAFRCNFLDDGANGGFAAKFGQFFCGGLPELFEDVLGDFRGDSCELGGRMATSPDSSTSDTGPPSGESTAASS